MRRWLRPLVIVLIGVASALAGGGVWAAWTGTASQSQAITSGNTAVTLGTAGTSANRIALALGDMTAGVTVYRALDVTNEADVSFIQIASAPPSPSSNLTFDSTNGLQLVIALCSVAWAETGTSPNFTYTCSGTTTTAFTGHVLMSTSGLLGLDLTDGATNHLRFAFNIPSATATTYEGLTSGVAYKFFTQQRTAGSR